MEKEELMKRIDEVISNDEKMKEIAEKLIMPFVKKKERDFGSLVCLRDVPNSPHFGVEVKSGFKKEQQSRDFFRWTIIERLERDIAYELGVPSDEDWENECILKYCIICNAKTNIFINGEHSMIKYSGVIYCLDKNFLDVVKSRISIDDLIFWCKYTKP